MPEPGRPPEEHRTQSAHPVAPARGAKLRPAETSSPAAPVSYPGAELLGSGSAAEVLARILVGDPLGLVARARAYLDEHAFLIDSNRLGLRTMAHVAHSARRYVGKPPLEEWLELLFERSVRELVDEDREGERSSRPIEADEIVPYGFVSDALGIEPALARRACVVFNGMVEYDRRAFYATTVLGKSLHRHVSEGHGPPARAEAALHRVLRRLASIDGMPGGGA